MNNFYKSKQWVKKRATRLRMDSYLCQECKRYGKTTQANTVHHIYPLEDCPEHKLTTDNLVSLCNKCHNSMHDRFTNELTQTGLRWKEKTTLLPHKN